MCDTTKKPADKKTVELRPAVSVEDGARFYAVVQFGPFDDRAFAESLAHTMITVLEEHMLNAQTAAVPATSDEGSLH